MASSLVKCSPKPLLISKVLHSGDSVRIGRRSSSAVLVKSPFISGTHCKIDVTRSGTESSGDLHFFVTDLSSNGTWLLKDPLKSRGNECLKSAKKLGKTKKEFLPSDCILLLAPAHQESMRYRFTVKRKGSEYILEQLPPTFEWKEDAAAAIKSSKGPKVNESESVIVGKKRSISASSGETRRTKRCGSSLSEAR